MLVITIMSTNGGGGEVSSYSALSMVKQKDPSYPAELFMTDHLADNLDERLQRVNPPS